MDESSCRVSDHSVSFRAHSHSWDQGTTGVIMLLQLHSKSKQRWGILDQDTPLAVQPEPYQTKRREPTGKISLAARAFLRWPLFLLSHFPLLVFEEVLELFFADARSHCFLHQLPPFRVKQVLRRAVAVQEQVDRNG